MDTVACASVDEDNAANDIVSKLQSLSIGDESDAPDGAGRTVTDLEAAVAVDVGNDVPAMVQAVDVAGDEREAKHKIFLSHSGAQKSFVDDLCADLMRCDRYPFFDKLRSSLPIGEKFPSRIFDAIEHCQVGVVVLSEEFFTRSKWPMLELAAMVEESKKPNRRILIIPVFYGISRDKCLDPNVQCEWMKKYWRKWEEGDKGRIDVEKWKSALGVFGSRIGIVKKDGMLDRELRAEIVEAICEEVDLETKGDLSHVQGMPRLYEEICEKVYKGVQPKDMKGEVRVVGLYGMGGIGKTTACKLLCSKLSREYCDKVCHVEFGSNNEVTLLQKVLSKLSDLDDKVLEKLDVDVGRGYLKTRIAKDKVFLALDNVTDKSKEEAKSYLRAKFGDGSVVLVTARSVEQLVGLGMGIRRDNCFAMVELELKEAKALFLEQAELKMSEVGEEFVEKCVRRCYFSRGESYSLDNEDYLLLALAALCNESLSSDDKHYHPLALKVLGSEVGDLIRNGKDKRAVLSRISDLNLLRQNESQVFSILRSSFDSMSKEDQLLFLDVALHRFIGYGGEFTSLKWLGMVHGKDGDEVEHMLECLKRRSLLESYVKESYTYGNWEFGIHDLWREFAEAEMKAGKFKDRRFVEWGGKWRGRVDLMEHPKLEVVELRVDGEDDVAVDVRGLKHLKSLDVSVPLSSLHIRVEVSGLGTLERLTYLDCWNVSSSECIAGLELLTSLQFCSLPCFRGDKLPDMSKLTSLRFLMLFYCEFLQCINLQSLPKLTCLNIMFCSSLRSVDISGCRSMTLLTVLEDESSELVELNVSSCPLIPSLDGVGHLLYALRKLNITGCSSIEELDDLIFLEELEELRARECERLAMLPEGRLPKLRVLDIEPWKVPAGFQWKVRGKIRRFRKTNDLTEITEGSKHDSPGNAGDGMTNAAL